MQFLTKILVLLAIVPTLALADANVSSDSSRKIDNSQSKSLKKDKSLSVDKSHGKRDSKSKSMEHSTEGSDSTGHSTKSHTGRENQQSTSYDLNLNSLLIQKFVERYESKQPDDSMPKAQFVFASCKPLTGLSTEFPILNGCPTSKGGLLDLENIVALNKATRFLDCGVMGGYYKRFEKMAGASNDGSVGDPYTFSDGIKDHGYMSKNRVNPQNPYVSKYARCRIIASDYVAEAAQRVIKAHPSTEDDVDAAIDATFKNMDDDLPLFTKLAARAADLWSQAHCTPWLTIARDFQKPDMHCGVLTIEGDESPRIVVQGRLTLNESSIAGRSYKIAVSTSVSDGYSAEDTTASDRRTSTASRRSDSSDTYDEGKKSATITKSKGLDVNENSDVNRSSGTHVSASPEK